MKSTLYFFLLLSIPLMGHSEEGALIDLMGAWQKFTHKTHLSLQNDNIKLANFYVHEIEEVLEEVEGVKQYKGYPIGKLAKKLIEPKLEALEKALKGEKIVSSKKYLGQLIDACNKCHRNTKHEFIKIELNNHNPYLQSFNK